jgi:membrane protease subunit (stomatin/prohibitin family)
VDVFNKRGEKMMNLKELFDIAYEQGYADGAEGRLKGEWEERYAEDDECKWTRRRFYCSACGEWQTYGKPNFCPNCGANMRAKHE